VRVVPAAVRHGRVQNVRRLSPMPAQFAVDRSLVSVLGEVNDTSIASTSSTVAATSTP
jgi:hypothetical protein